MTYIYKLRLPHNLGEVLEIQYFVWLIILLLCLPIINQMNIPKIMGPQDYQWFYHTSSEDLVCVEKKGYPIPLSHPLDTHIETIDPSELWNSIQHGIRSTSQI